MVNSDVVLNEKSRRTESIFFHFVFFKEGTRKTLYALFRSSIDLIGLEIQSSKQPEEHEVQNPIKNVSY